MKLLPKPPKNMQTNGPKPIIIALKAIVLHTFGVQVLLGQEEPKSYRYVCRFLVRCYDISTSSRLQNDIGNC